VKYKEFGYVNKFQVTGSVVVIRWGNPGLQIQR
jgi:hypothetical protein